MKTEKQKLIEKEFYRKCGEILSIDHHYQTPPKNRKRWYREKGNGRYPGFGLIKIFSLNQIHVTFRGGNRLFSSMDEVYSFLYQETENRNAQTETSEQ